MNCESPAISPVRSGPAPVPSRAPCAVIGQGEYGRVYRQDGKAIKSIPCLDSDEVATALKEAILHHFLGQSTNITTFHNFDAFFNEDGKICKVGVQQELLECNLRAIIASRQALSLDHVQAFAYQIALGLNWMHSWNVAHLDLKPSNLVINSECSLRIIDFGFSDYFGKRLPAHQWEKCTIWYRPPELFPGMRDADPFKVDAWSLGAILVELLSGVPPFAFASGSVPANITDEEAKTNWSNQAYVRKTAARAVKLRTSMREAVIGKSNVPRWMRFKDSDTAKPLLLDLICKLLDPVPANRPSMDQVLAHPFFDDVRSTDEIEVASQVPDAFFSQWRSEPEPNHVTLCNALNTALCRDSFSQADVRDLKKKMKLT